MSRKSKIDKAIIRAVIASLTDHPGDWTGDGKYRISRAGGDQTIGLSCGLWGLEISVYVTVQGRRDLYQIGGTNSAAMFFWWAIPWRRKVYRLAVPLLGEAGLETIQAAALKQVLGAS